MTFRKVRFFVVALALSALFLASGAGQPASTSAASGGGATAAAKAAPQANWVFEGCWTQWPAGPCRDVYRDSQGSYWICRDCGTTGSPSTSKCSRISSSTLATGYWCS
jgi:hypothetical protein